MGAQHWRALDRCQRARRPRRRDAAGLSDLGARWRLLWLALLLLGTDGGRPGAAGSGHGREGDSAGLCARRAYCVARPVLDAIRYAARLSGWHGDRPTRLLESQYAERLRRRLRAVRERAPVRPAAGYSDGVPRAGREGLVRTAGR